MRRVKAKRRTNNDLLLLYGIDSDAAKDLARLLNVTPGKAVAQVQQFFLAARSGYELSFKSFARAEIERVAHDTVVFLGHEWMTFNLPGGHYTPDWCAMLSGGGWVFVENKGSKQQANYRDARSKLRAAASLNPWYEFYEAMPSRDEPTGWKMERIEADPSFARNIVELLEAKS